MLNVLRPGSSSSLAVLGTGAVGLSAEMAAHLVGCGTIIAVDVVPARLELARKLGATHAIDGTAEDVVERVREITGGGAHFSLECTGNPQVLRRAVDMLGSDATCGVMGAPPFGTDVGLDVNERFPTDRLVSTFRFDEINDAVAAMEAGQVIKPVVLFD